MAAGIVRIVAKLPSFPNTSGRATLTNRARTAGVKSIALNERGWKFESDTQAFRTAIVFFLKGRMGRSRIDRVNGSTRTVHPDTSVAIQASRFLSIVYRHKSHSGWVACTAICCRHLRSRSTQFFICFLPSVVSPSLVFQSCIWWLVPSGGC
ncbi:hypothetical protein AVEN_118517-1 [Araneus ventricosus]|uniref:Uncharacterized protein n=1 Tax=Araneus ventricosus TaxID=182803 RepID=A0A4Y2NNG5_ARAVE|nr:hypothetical protein AVEN_118517-1 [Araneus ventricosus]